VNLPIDPKARPLLERLECEIQIDHDYVAHAILRSNGRGKKIEAEFHQLDFGLSLQSENPPPEDRAEDKGEVSGVSGITHSASGSDSSDAQQRSNVTLRSNISDRQEWTLVPGDLIKIWRPNFLDKYSIEATEIQREEEMYYRRCVYCERTLYQIRMHGPVEICRQVRCSEATT
ncbi:MAG: hypothetical protein ACREB6_16890, partial [Rhodospirillales bacterium]